MPAHLLPLAALAAAVAAGCQNLGTHSKDPDPMLGSTPASLRGDPPYNHPSGSDSAPKPPPPPASHSLTSTATAAGQQPSSTDTGATSAVPPPPSPSGAALAAPQPLEGSTSRSAPPAAVALGQWPTAAPSPSPAAAGTVEQLQKQLEQRGMRYLWWQHVAETGEWKLTCSVLTDPHTPDLLTTYKQSSYGDSGVGALRDVLQKIDQDRQKAR